METMNNQRISRVPRMRTIKAAIKELRRIDQNSDFTEWRLRQLIRAHNIPCVHAGCKILIDIDVLFEYLKNGEREVESTSPLGVRKIKR